ncbi:putative glycosly transferase [Litoreibacter arenae DSM 19593]|uniref:Putative glycosly transferase n=1 Tax=Litoreibacter arenae DSM 19593 TaxID=1123360 RepID=S9QJ70_9RHOB|nr:putative glycosly transferase [Litoreibacter arenae DSM 19593]
MTFNLVEGGRSASIRRAAESLWAQNFHSVEHIVQDGGSNDGTQTLLGAIVADASDHVPTYLESEPDKGIYDGMNRAVARANGRYVIFLNSDDLLGEPDALQKLAEPLKAGDCDFAFGLTAMIDPDTGARKLLSRPSLEAVLQRMPFGHNATAFRRGLFDDLGGHDLSFPVASDYDFVLRMVAAGSKGERVDAVVSQFLKGGASANAEAVRRDYAAIWGKVYGPWVDLSGDDQATRELWHKAGHMPFRIPFAIWRNRQLAPGIRRAAWHSMMKSLRRTLTGRGLR